MKILLAVVLLIISSVAAKKFSPQIIGGHEALPEQFPFKVAIYVYKEFECGGSIISEMKSL